MSLAYVGRVLTFAVLMTTMVLVMHQSGCCGPVFVPKEHIAERGDGRCSYHSCNEPATGRYQTKVYSHFSREGARDVTYYDARELPLCDRHARSARMERWPESGPVETWFHAIVSGGFLGAILSGIVVSIFFPSKRRKANAPEPSPAPPP